MGYIFIHGWGYDASFWQSLQNEMNIASPTNIEMGFLGQTPQTPEITNPSIFITHSLGAMYALHHYSHVIEKLIIINGFYRFTDFTNKRLLKTMQLRLRRTPIDQMTDFWTLCGSKPDIQNLNQEQLSKGLDWLSSWDESDKISGISNDNTLILAGGKDNITPAKIMKNHWQKFNLHLYEEGNHTLPITQTTWCAEKIQDFLI